jgi:Kef-type K+ transport system membrane component KefB
MPAINNISEVYLIAMLIIFTLPYLIWRMGKTEFYAPLVVVQIITGILLGPSVLGAIFPHYYQFIFNQQVIQLLDGIAWWAVMLFVMIAGIELDIKKAWEERRESAIAASLALSCPLIIGSIVAIGMLAYDGWIDESAKPWQFVLGIGMACSVTALPILILLMDKLTILRQPIGQRILRYTSLDDLLIWFVLAIILLDWSRVGSQLAFLITFVLAALAFRQWMPRLQEADRWYVSLAWLALNGFSADWAGLHFMVGAFLAGAVMNAHWFNQEKMDLLRDHILLIMMPVFFLSTGLKTQWNLGGTAVIIAAVLLLIAAVGGKLIGTHLAGKILKWKKGEAVVIGWLLQTKALIMIVFANILLDKHIITNDTFTALLLMAILSTMLTVPMVYKKLQSLIPKTSI